MNRPPNEGPPSENFDAQFEEIVRQAEAEIAKGGPGSPADPGSGSADWSGPVGPPVSGVGRHWAVTTLTLLVAMAGTAVAGLYANFAIALVVGLVLFAVVMGVATQTGYRGAQQSVDKVSDIPLGLGAAVAVLSLAYFAPVFYLASAGKEGVTSDVFTSHGSRRSVSCTAVLPNGKTSRVTCPASGDKNELSAGHYRVVYDADGTLWARLGTKADLPVALGGAVVGLGVVAFGFGAGAGASRANKPGRPTTTAV